MRAAKAVDYEGAGTIEFIADASEGLRADRIFFMEMNTRLQVEHPVTEEITGVDLVEWQLRVASGEPIPLKQEELSINGHAIEARLYAEDPAKGFLPSTGRLDHLGFHEAGRIETGVEQGDAGISPFYDPMIAKLVAWGHDRYEAIDLLAIMAEEVEIWPVKTNAAFLARAIDDQDFDSANLDTGFIERKLEKPLIPEPSPSPEVWHAAATFAADNNSDQFIAAPSGFRLNAIPTNDTITLNHGGDSRAVDKAASGELPNCCDPGSVLATM